MTHNEEQRRLIECYGIKDTIYQQTKGGILAVRIAVQKAMDCKIGEGVGFGYNPQKLAKIGLTHLSGNSKRVVGWAFNVRLQRFEICSLNPAKPRPTMFRVNRFAFFNPKPKQQNT